LRRFSANDDVTFEYGTAAIDGERLLFDNVRKLVNVWGYKEGASKRTDAQITIEDPRAGVPTKPVRSPVLIYDIRNDVIKVDRVEGGGGM
jgi:hypothetical protein